MKLLRLGCLGAETTTVLGVLVWVLLLGGGRVSQAQPYGLTNRPVVGAFLDSAFPAVAPAPAGGWSVAPVFTNLTFLNPLGLAPVPGTNLLCVWEREGRAYVFVNQPGVAAKTQIFDLSAQCQGWDDAGLLGLAFHPGFATNRHVFIWYNWVTPGTVIGSPTTRPPTQTPTRNRLSRLTLDANMVIVPGSETVFIDQNAQSVWHNGGGMFFHPDNGLLHVTNGDDANGVHNQRINVSLFSGVLRIDVDRRGGSFSHPIPRQPVNGFTTNYYIPNDNPFVGQPGVLEEFFCIGLRSPHRMTHDPVSGRIFIGDVGAGSREEIDVIEPGESGLNFQWSVIEGLGGDLTPPYIGVNRRPILDYSRSDGSAVIGGYVYRGTEHAADLGGRYIFADNIANSIWYMDETTVPVSKVFLTPMPKGSGPNSGSDYTGISSFGVDHNNELYICQLSSVAGRLYKLIRTGPPSGPPYPARLSDTGAFTNLATLAARDVLLPYEVNSPLWSDGAHKLRWAVVPNDGAPYGTNETVGFAPTGEWTFPVGSMLVKHFEISTNDAAPGQRRRLETRFLGRDTNGAFYGVTYKWRADQSDADLMTAGLNENIVIHGTSGIRTQVWTYPSRQECLNCHTPQAGFVLGVKTRQLNGDATYPGGVTDNQLRTWNHLGMFTPSVNEAAIAGYDRMVSVGDTNAALEARVRSYIDANCAHCHRPGGVQAFWDGRWDTPLASQNLIDGPLGNDLGLDGARVIVARDVWRSMLYHRDRSTDPVIRMPPLARNLVDTGAMAVVSAWINSLPGTPALAPPYFTPPGGVANLPVAVSLGHEDPLAEIRYTLDGSSPSAASILYTGPLLVTNTVTIRARAFRGGYQSSVVAAATFVFPRGTGTIVRNVYLGLGGSVLPDLTNSAKFPNQPDLVTYPSSFETPPDSLDNYGVQLKGYLIPPVSGLYDFFLSADDEAVLYLSTDSDPANRYVVATEPIWNGQRDWLGTDRRNAAAPENRSATRFPSGIFLEAGVAYYIEALMKEGGGGDNLAVAWHVPGEPPVTAGSLPIQGVGTFTSFAGTFTNLSSSLTAGPVFFTGQPASLQRNPGETATFACTVDGTPPYTFQWQTNGTSIPGATNSVHTTPVLTLADNGARYSVIAVNLGGAATATSSVAVLTVIGSGDTTPPAVVSVGSVGGASIGVCFTEAVAGALSPASYVVNGGAVPVSAVSLRPDGRSVSLTLGAPVTGAFSVAVSGVTDVTGNGIVAPNQTLGVVLGLTDTDVGGPAAAGGSYACAGDDFEVNGGGADIWDAGDQFHFAWQFRTNDFDVRVLVQELSQSDISAKAGLMVRESLAGDSRTIHSTVMPPPPARNIYETAQRLTTGGGSVGWGNLGSPAENGNVPATHPNSWIRLRREGGFFTTYSSLDGTLWTEFGRTTQAYPAVVYFGVAVTAHNNSGVLSTARFRNFGDLVAPATPPSIIVPPASLVLTQGGAGVLSVVAAGNPVPGYVWRRNGVDLPGAGGASLLLSNVTAASAGNYTVVATNVAGAATSAVAVVTVLLPPTVALTAPTPGAAYLAPATVQLTASPADPDGSVVLVEFFANAVKLGERTGPPWEFTWTNVAAGNPALTARAVDNHGLAAVSAAVDILVTNEPAAFNLAINFQMPSSVTPVGYLPDTGVVFADRGNGYSYGWDSDGTANARDRDLPNSPDQRYDTLVHLQKPEGSHVWELALPNGVYQVHLVAGDPGFFDGYYQLTLEGVVALEGQPTDPVRWIESTNLVTVADGRLTLAAGPAGVNSKICFLRIAAAAVPNTPPTVALTAPAAGAVLPLGAAVTVTATATDNGSVSQVEFFNGASSIGAVTNAPFTVPWTNAPAGPAALSARATDNAGLVATSAVVNVVISNAAPTVVVTSPLDGAAYPTLTNLNLAATAADADGSVVRVEFFAGATKVGESMAPPHAVAWLPPAAGLYLITARATDDLGLTADSVPVAVSITNRLPVVAMTAPADGLVAQAPVNLVLSATASDPDGTVAYVSFYDGAALLVRVTNSPYNWTWNGVPPGSHQLSAAATDNSGATVTSAARGVVILPPPAAFTNLLVATNAVWRYKDDGSNQGTNWAVPSFNDAAWLSGPAQLGFGDGDEATVINGGPVNNRYITTYFRRAFVVTNATEYTNLIVRVLRDDGARVYLNGVEIFRNNLPSSTLTFTTRASSDVTGAAESTFISLAVSPTRLVPGTNVLAAEVHQRNLTSSDLSFSLSLTGYGITAGGGGGGGGGAGFSIYGSAPPVAAEFQAGGDLFQLVIVSVPGADYLIEASEDLIDWSTLGTVKATGTRTVVSDPESQDGRAMRFYRVRLMP